MAFKTVSQFKDSLKGILTGLNLNNATNVNTSIERAARELTARISIPEAMGKQAVTLYDGVTDYTLATNLFGSSIIDFRPQGAERNVTDYVTKQPIALWDRTKAYISSGYRVTFEFINGVGRLRVVSTVPTPRIQLDSMSLKTGWTTGGSTGTLYEDTTVVYRQPSSLRFNLTGASTGTLTKTISAQDFTNYVGVGVVFLAIRTPSASNLTSIEVRLGSDASNYYSVTATTGFLGSFTAGEWIHVALDLSGATTVGTPTATAIDYAQISIAHAATLTNFYIGDFWVALPSPHDFLYQTAAIFQASGANPSQTITNNDDTLLLSDAALNVFEYLAAETIAQSQGGTLSSGLVQQIQAKLNGQGNETGLIDIFRGENPNQNLRTVGNYYDD